MTRTPDLHLPAEPGQPFDYLTELQRHADALAASPRLWMPWNYRGALA
jgi:hypothetical protein